MFERFSTQARAAVIEAQAHGRRLGQGRIGTEHLLLALAVASDGVARRVLEANGVHAGDIEAAIAPLTSSGDDDGLDAEALRSIGIDLDAVREKVETAFGPGALDARDTKRGGHIPFSPRAKKVLELSLREAIRLKHKVIGDGHLLLGILREGDGLAAKIVAEAGVDLAALRTAIEHELGRPPTP